MDLNRLLIHTLDRLQLETATVILSTVFLRITAILISHRTTWVIRKEPTSYPRPDPIRLVIYSTNDPLFQITNLFHTPSPQVVILLLRNTVIMVQLHRIMPPPTQLVALLQLLLPLRAHLQLMHQVRSKLVSFLICWMTE